MAKPRVKGFKTWCYPMPAMEGGARLKRIILSALCRRHETAMLMNPCPGFFQVRCLRVWR